MKLIEHKFYDCLERDWAHRIDRGPLNEISSKWNLKIVILYRMKEILFLV